MKNLSIWDRSSITSANRKLLLSSLESEGNPQALGGSCSELCWVMARDQALQSQQLLNILRFSY